MLGANEEMLVSSYCNKGAIIDTNLYVLWLVGLMDPQKIGKHKRVKNYEVEDYRTLAHIVSRFNGFYTTPNIVTEVSNIIDSGSREIINGINEVFYRSIVELQECYIPSQEVIRDTSALRLGVADVTVKITARRGLLLITDDLDLALNAGEAGCGVLNFNHIRNIYG